MVAKQPTCSEKKPSPKPEDTIWEGNFRPIDSASDTFDFPKVPPTIIAEDRQAVIGEINEYFILHAFELDDDESSDKVNLYYRLDDALHLLEAGSELPTLLRIEIFIFSHATGLPVPRFIINWLYSGALRFYKKGGLRSLEECLGFTVNKDGGANAGRGHEFKKAIKDKLVNKPHLFFLMRMLNKFEGITVKHARDCVLFYHDAICEIPIGPSTLEKEYKAFFLNNNYWSERQQAQYRAAWEKHRPEWIRIFKELGIAMIWKRDNRRKGGSHD